MMTETDLLFFFFVEKAYQTDLGLKKTPFENKKTIFFPQSNYYLYA